MLLFPKTPLGRLDRTHDRGLALCILVDADAEIDPVQLHASDLVDAERETLARLVTHERPLSEIASAFETAADKQRSFGRQVYDDYRFNAVAFEPSQLGARAIVMRPNPIGGRTLCHPALEPVWSLLEELDIGTDDAWIMERVGIIQEIDADRYQELVDGIERVDDLDRVVHRTGHSFGVTGHEGPFLALSYDREIEPGIPFGHGLSYTTFEYGPLDLPGEVTPGEKVEVALEVVFGERAGDVVAQLGQLFVARLVQLAQELGLQ